MNFRRIWRWLGWSAAVLAVAFAALVWSAIRDARDRFASDRTILAETLGISTNCSDLEEQIRASLSQHPERVLPLFESSDPTVRTAAFRTSALLPDLSEAQSARIAEIFAQTPPHERRAWMESYQFRVRWPALLSRLESVIAVDPQLGADVAYSFGRRSLVVPIERLRATALNSDFSPANRSWALTALGLAGKSAESVAPTFESLAQDRSAPVALASRIALARIRNTPDPDRLRTELADARSRFPWELREPLALIASFGAAAHELGPEVLKELRPLDHDQGASAAVTLMAIGYREAIPQLITAAKNDDDWQLAEFACEALGRFGAAEAESTLRVLAANHYDSSVRAAAREALASLRDGYS